jgi:ATP-dependent Lhr-like helicase
MPFWHGEYGARSAHLTARVGELRRTLAMTDDAGALAKIEADYQCDEPTARSLVQYAKEQRAATGTVPDDRVLVAEHFRDEAGSVRIVLHAPFGGRVNAPWAMALAQRFREALSARAVDVQVQTTDDGIMLRLPQLDSAPPMQLLHGLSPEEATQRITAEIGSSSLFGARFRMNAARALLLPRGNPRRRMPLWLQRLKAQDLLEAVREFPSFPILVETYRDVLQDAFDLAALRGVLRDLEEGRITIRSVQTDVPSPMALSLQFGFVMDWMYADDTPRAERAAAMLSLDTALLEDLLGTPGELEENLSDALRELLARRRGTAPERRARTADELALLLDRAGDLTMEELRERVSEGATVGEPISDLLSSGRAIVIEVATSGGVEQRLVLVESLPRYLSAFGGTAIPDAVPAAFRTASLTEGAARREILARFLAMAGPVTVDEIRQRYDFDGAWIERRLADWTERGTLLRGRFSLPGYESALRWCSRRLIEHARRRALAAARRQIEAVSLEAFALFMLRWQHVAPDSRLRGQDGLVEAMRQLYGIARPPLGWESEYLPARVEDLRAAALSQLSASGEFVWVGEGARDAVADAAVGKLRGVRFLRRGSERAWLAPITDPLLSDRAQAARQLLQSRGALFFFELQQATGLGSHALRDALRELVVAGLVTNDTVDALVHVARWRPLFQDRRPDDPDPARWLPADFVPSPNRPVVQRRVNVRRLPRWKRPDREGGDAPWPGRWSLLDRKPPPQGHFEEAEGALAAAVATQWLDRYGVVARDWWRRERPPVPWRAIYRELRRMELRGDVRRGYFVRGLAGAQFALPAAVEQLRAAASSADGDELMVIAASDPANVWSLPVVAEPGTRDTFARPRGARALLLLRGGRVILTADAHLRAVAVRPDVSDELITAAVRTLLKRMATRRSRDIVVETIDGGNAATSPHAPAFIAAGLRLTTSGLRYYASFDRE